MIKLQCCKGPYFTSLLNNPTHWTDKSEANGVIILPPLSMSAYLMGI